MIVVSHEKIDASSRNEEVEKVVAAFDSVVEEKRTLLSKSFSEEEKALYTVEILMLEDPEYRARIYSLIEDEDLCASWAVEKASEEIAAVLSASEDEYFRERILDIRDIERSLLETVSGKRREHIVLTRPSILVSDNLLTSEILGFEGNGNLLGIALDQGGITSHVSIIAKNRGIPTIVGLENFSSAVAEGEIVALDAFKGMAYFDLDKKARLFFESRIDRIRTESEILRESFRHSSRKLFTRDGHRVFLEANVDDDISLERSIKDGCEGIGLFRTEFLFLRKEQFPTEESRAHIYQESARKLKEIDGSITFRTLDIGGDKVGENHPSLDETNPILGFRAIRFCLGNPEIFSSQIRSILKASAYGNVRIMFPLVSGIEDLSRCLEILEREKSSLRKAGIGFDEEIEVGTMIEVPSAAITSDLLADAVSFFSIGTNDLVQYVLAVDRGNEKVQSLYRPYHPAILRLVRTVIENASRKGVRVGVCGQIASELEAIPLLIGLGVNEISVSPHSLLFVRSFIQDLDYSDCRKLANNVLSMRSYIEIEKEIKEFYNERKTRNQE